MTGDRTGEVHPRPGSAKASGPHSPTRRRLLALLAVAPVAGSADMGTAPSAPAPPDDPIPRLFAQFEALTAAHERALARVDRLEANLVARRPARRRSSRPRRTRSTGIACRDRGRGG